MNKIFVVHYYPLEYFPPVTNLLNVISGRHQVSVVTTEKDSALREYDNSDIKIYRPVSTRLKKNRLLNLISYIYFTLFALLKILLLRPDILVYYESISALAPYIYKRYINKSVKLYIHYHEYMTPEEYARPGMQISRFNHVREKVWLYNYAYSISHTNYKRVEFFLHDNPSVNVNLCRVLPNYPPKSWHVKSKSHDNEVIRCVYVGSLSIEDMYIVEFCNWINQQNGRVLFDVFAFNYKQSVADYLNTLNSPYVVFHDTGVEYSDIPHLLSKYNVGLLLYKPKNKNVVFSEPNKLFEYLICGLDVWYPVEMELINNLRINSFQSKLQVLNFRKLDDFKVVPTEKVVSNDKYSNFAECEYNDLF